MKRRVNRLVTIQGSVEDLENQKRHANIQIQEQLQRVRTNARMKRDCEEFEEEVEFKRERKSEKRLKKKQSSLFVSLIVYRCFLPYVPFFYSLFALNRFYFFYR